MMRRGALADRAAKLREDHRRMKDRARAAASQGWDATPCSTARMSAQLVQRHQERKMVPRRFQRAVEPQSLAGHGVS